MSRFRITVRGDGTELRGYIDGEDPAILLDFSDAMKPFGIVIASPAEDDYDPFAISEPEDPPSLEQSRDIIEGIVLSSPSVEDMLTTIAVIHQAQAVVIRGERGRAERAEKELLSRELHHFEIEHLLEGIKADAERVARGLEDNWEHGDLAGAVREAIAMLRVLAAQV